MNHPQAKLARVLTVIALAPWAYVLYRVVTA
jgi:hypothetical protein